MVVAIVCALLIGTAGVAGAGVLGGGGGGAELVVSVEGDGVVVSDDGSIRCGDKHCSAEQRPNTELLLRAQPQPGWEFARWDGACSGRGVCRVLLTTDTGVVARFKPVGEPHEVTVRVRGKGTVVSHPAGIACGADEDCQATFTRSRKLALIAAAAPGHRFDRWSDGCTGTARCDIEGDARRTVVNAHFVADPDAVRLAVDIRGSGLGKVSSAQSGIDCGELCAAGFERGARVRLAAIPQPGSRFDGWSDPSCGSRSAKTCTITLVRSSRVVARFTRDEALPAPEEDIADDPPEEPREPTEPTKTTAAARHTLRVLATGSGRGSVTSAPAAIRCGANCDADFEHGTSVRLTATAGEASKFTGWSGAGCAGTGACVVTVDRAQSVQARFDATAPNTHVLTVSVAGKGRGSVISQPTGIRCGSTCRSPFEQGHEVTLTATPDAGSDFVGWRGAGCADTGTCVVTVDQALTVAALFEPATHPPQGDLHGRGYWHRAHAAAQPRMREKLRRDLRPW